MTKAQTLRLKARSAAEIRGHELEKFRSNGPTSWYAECTNEYCAAWVIVDIDPEANGIDIGGPIVATTCPLEEVT